MNSDILMNCPATIIVSKEHENEFGHRTRSWEEPRQQLYNHDEEIFRSWYATPGSIVILNRSEHAGRGRLLC